MKKALNKSLTIIGILIASCSSGEGNSEKFIGKWQSLESKERPPMVIEKRDENLIIDNKAPATYDKENHKISVNIPMAGTVDIIYLADKDHILVSGAGEYSRIE